MNLRIVLACLLVWGALGATGYYLVAKPDPASPSLGVESGGGVPPTPLPVTPAPAQLATPSRQAATSPLPTVAGLPPAPEVPGLRLECTVTDSETNSPVPAAEVLVSLDNQAMDRRTALGRARTDGTGLARLSLAAIASQPKRLWKGQLLTIYVQASGHEPSESSVRIQPLPGGVVRTDVELDRVPHVILGRVVDGDLQPVAEAHVSVVTWGTMGRTVENDDRITDPFGLFSFSPESVGRVDVMASHPAHGVVHRNATLERDSTVLDLGDLVLLPTGPQISGRVVAMDGSPLPGAQIEAEVVEDDAVDSYHEVRAGDRGTFRLAALGPWSYRLESPIVDEAPYLAPGGHTDVVLRSDYPSAQVRVLDVDGAPLPPGDTAIHAVRRDGDHVVRHKVGPRDTWIHGEFLVVLFRSPGLHSISFAYEIGGVHNTASEVIEMDSRHRTIELRLAPEQRLTVPVTVVGPGGESVAACGLRLYSLEDATYLGSARAEQGQIQVRPGPLRILATPEVPSFVLPFETIVEIQEPAEPIALRGTSIGGHLRLETLFEGAAKRVRSANLLDSNGSRLRVVAVDGTWVFTKKPLPPGSYKWLLAAGDHRPATKPMEVQQGQTTHGRVFLKAE